MSNRAWVTLATNDSYGLGALVLAHSLRRVGSTYPAVVLITPSVTDAMRDRLRAIFAEVITVDVLDSQDATHLALLQRPELGITFTKIHCWNLTQYERCVFLDADILVVQNCDELFEREELSAAPDVGWPDCFNSGVFVFQPSADTFSRLVTFAQERGSFDGGDQGLLNSFFSSWSTDGSKRLPFLYNVTSAAFYSYLPALKHYGQDLKIIHFIGPAKPWLQHYNFATQSVDAPEHLKGFLQLWWDLFTSQVHIQLDESMTGVAGNLARVQPGIPLQHEAIDELTRRQGWESGNIDYMGADSFANIWAKISETLNQVSSSPPKQPSPPKETPQVSEEKAKDAVEELAEKVAVASISQPSDIPVPVIEAAKAAGKPSESPVTAIEVPEISPVPVSQLESKVLEAEEKICQAPNETVAAVEVSPSHDVPKDSTELTKVEPETSVTEADAAPSADLPDTPSEPTESTHVHEVPTHDNDAPKPDSISEKPVDVHAVEPISETPIEPQPELVVVPETASEVSIVAPQEEPIAPLSDVHESKPAEISSGAESEPAVPESKPEVSVPSDVHEPVPVSEVPIVDQPPVVPESKPLEPETNMPLEPSVEAIQVSQVVSPVETPQSETISAPPAPTQEQSPDKKEAPVSDSPPLANTPSQEEIPSATAAKSLEEAAQETRL